MEWRQVTRDEDAARLRSGGERVERGSSFTRWEVAAYPELEEDLLRVVAGVDALERQIEIAIEGLWAQVRETERELRRPARVPEL